MHLGNSIICPVTGITMIATMGSCVIYAIKNSKMDFKKENLFKILTLAMFVFVLQMLNFSFSGLNFSVHIIGAIFLCILLNNKNFAFLLMSGILTIQSLLFNDGGVLALGCNIFNMGFLPCMVIYPIFSKITKNQPLNIFLSTFLATMIGVLALGCETYLSGSIKTISFINLMILFHLPLAIIESLFTIFGVKFLQSKTNYNVLAIVVILSSIFATKFASSKPDGLEWALIKLNDNIIYNIQGNIYNFSQLIQSKTSILQDNSYGAFVLVGIVLAIAFLTKENKCQKIK